MRTSVVRGIGILLPLVLYLVCLLGIIASSGSTQLYARNAHGTNVQIVYLPLVQRNTVSIPTNTPTPVPTPVYPLKVSGNGRYLIDQNNVPFLIVGDSPQDLPQKLSEIDADSFLANRKAAGFNTVWFMLLCGNYNQCNGDGTTYDGIAPFTTPGDLSTPNEAYFKRMDDMINLAAKYGLTVLLDPAETGDWLTTMVNNNAVIGNCGGGASKSYCYGVYLGNRYKGFPNIIWLNGMDFGSWQIQANDAAVLAVAKGIQSVDPGHIHTIELGSNNPPCDCISSLDDPNWASVVSLNAAYTYSASYIEVLHAYNQAIVPAFLVEGNYEFGNNVFDYGSPRILRMQEYWSALSGSTGQLYGNAYTWRFTSGWQSYVDTTGSVQFGYVKNLLAPRAWWNLVPDQNHAVVTAGYGTFSSGGSSGANDYLTAARTSDGKLVLAYMPTARTITVNMTQLTGSTVTAQWYDPTNGTYTTIAGSPFTNSGSRNFTPPSKNSGGDSDWVLVLEAN